MIEIRLGHERGHANHGWLDSWHSFSFADYHDPAHMHWGALRVINEDRVAPGEGFGAHGHRDMEIISYVLSGSLEHRDNLGNGTVIRPGDVQRMSAGQGVVHSEFNPSGNEPVHFLQIWIMPEVRGVEPSYEQTCFPEESRQGRLCLIASPDGEAGSVRIHQEANLYASLLTDTEAVTHAFEANRLGYLHVARGSVLINGNTLSAGDGARIANERAVTLTGASPSGEILLFDLPHH